jgi:pre-rRNA-processing protein TSR2
MEFFEVPRVSFFHHGQQCELHASLRFAVKALVLLMAQVRQNGPVATPKTSAIPSKTPSNLNAQIDLVVSLHLHNWPALTLAVQNGWGGDQQLSSDKRDWFAGAVSDLLTSSPPQISDVSDLEEVLLQVMLDEFEIVVDDGSAEEVAKNIWSSAEKLQKGDLGDLEALHAKWQERQAKGGESATGIVRGQDEDGNETDWDEDGEEEEWNGFDDNPDTEMGYAPQLLEAKPKVRVEPDIDEEGFTKVVSKKRR